MMENELASPRNLNLSEIYRDQEAAFLRQEAEKQRAKISVLRDRVLQEPHNPSAYIDLAGALGTSADSVKVLQEGLAQCQPHLKLYRKAVYTLWDGNRIDEALEVIRCAEELFPGDMLFRFLEELILPVLYETPEDIQRYRSRFSSGLQRLTATLELDTPDARHAALDAVTRHTNFYLPYQGENDRELQRQYGELVCRIMAANYPQWTRPPDMPPLSPGGKIRVGYVSEEFRNHSVSKTQLGWLVELDRQPFEVFAYYVRRKVDAVTEEARRSSDHFYHIPDDLEQTCQAILADDLHIVVFLDIGMDPLMTQLAALRLAPIQCVAWGHPVTSGLPTVDYFLSGELMEPEDGQDHYSERLIRLPGIATCYRKPVIPRPLLGKSRADFGLGEDRRVFLCCQSSFKYLPQHDDVFVRIAKRSPASQFVFLGFNDLVGNDFRARLDRAFAAEGLEARNHCIILRAHSWFDYFNLALVSDAFLDSLEWSGGITTFEAVACGLPVLTLPGRFMRGRQSYGILTQLGVTDTIARNKQEYGDIAVRLAQDREWRAQILKRMKANFHLLYSDTRSVRALEDFFRDKVTERLGKYHASRPTPDFVL
jgi:predicted O-linked N-acetylglucosamine transferase (SPINDLY family)